MRGFVLCVLSLVVGGCGGGGTEPSDDTTVGTGSLVVTLTRVPGTPALFFSASVRVGNSSPSVVRDWDEHTVSGLAAGTHQVDASGLTNNCTFQGGPSKSVTINANQVAHASFQVHCSFDTAPRIVFNKHRGEWNYDIWTANPDGTNQIRLTTSGHDLAPSWSPDGTRIAFGNHHGVQVMNYDGTELRDISLDGQLARPVWSPDGTKIAYHRYGDSDSAVWVINVDGTGEVNLTDFLGHHGHPAWSHDGQQMAYCRDMTVLTVMGSDGTNHTPLTGEIGCSEPTWSLNDEEIVFASPGQFSGVSSNLWRVGADGSGLIQVTAGQDARSPGYSPDGSAILFHAPEGGPEQVERAWIIDVDGENQRLFDPIPEVGVMNLRWWAN